jgi:MoxR-like ATPase
MSEAVKLGNEMTISGRLISNIETVFFGKPEVARLAVACLLAEGHALIDDVPGVGKTTLSLALAKSVGGTFQRLQFTSDLLPSDVTGMSVFNPSRQDFDFRSGPLFNNIVLADEINRASPKTQSALLEAMQERQVSVDGVTHPLPRPFFVIATQNPHEHHGTFPLPESQLDRFMMRLEVGYPSAETEMSILRGDAVAPLVNSLSPVASAGDVVREIERVRAIAVDPSLDKYIVDIAHASRASAHVELGLSPRGTLALRRAAQALAVTENRAFVIPDDVRAACVPVIAHRLMLRSSNYNGSSTTVAASVVQDLLEQVNVPR